MPGIFDILYYSTDTLALPVGPFKYYATDKMALSHNCKNLVLLEFCKLHKGCAIGSFSCVFCDNFVERNYSEHWIICEKIKEAIGIKKIRKEKLNKLTDI